MNSSSGPRTLPRLLARIAAAAGLLVSGAAGAWLSLFATSDSFHWVFPQGHATAFVLVGSAALNVLLLARADALRRPVAVALALASLCLSMLIAGVFAHAALTLPT